MPNLIPQRIAPLFHNYHTEKMDVVRDAEWIILTILMSGTLEQIQWAFATYGWDRIEAVAHKDLAGLKILPPIVANYWSVVFWNRPLPPVSIKERWGTIRRIPPETMEDGADVLLGRH